jgi:membrane protein
MADLTSPSPVYNPWKLGGLSLKELMKRVWQQSQDDDILGRAAQLGFYFLLGLFPALLFLTALVGLLPVQSTLSHVMDYLRQVLPPDALSLVEKYLQQVVQGSGKGILSLGFLGALWASSNGLAAIMETLNAVYNVKETRSLWTARLIAIAMTIGLAGFVILSTVLVLSGEYIGQWIANLLGLSWVFTVAWELMQWPVVMALMLFAISVIYFFGPNVKQDWRWVTPGSLFAVIMWLVVSLGFRLYVEHVGDYNAAYGSIGGVIVLMLWFYLCGIVLLMGGEINSEIAKAATKQAERRAEPTPLRRSGRV